MNVNNVTKSAITVAEMARMCGLSRARMYQLMAQGVFPQPLYQIKTKRPYFNEELQQVCLQVRRQNCGINGQPVLFYNQRSAPTFPNKRKKTSPKPINKHMELIEGLKGLGMTATSEQVENAINNLPNGKGNMDEGELLRSVFLFIKRQD